MTGTTTSGNTSGAAEFRAGRVVAAARELALEGGYEAVQMREVAHRANVALATVYRYYPSKDDLLNTVVDRELADFAEQILQDPPRQRNPASRVAETFNRAFRRMTADRGFAHAIMASYHVLVPYDESVERAAAGVDMGARTNEFIDIVIRVTWGAGYRASVAERRALYILEAMWAGNLIDWLNSRISSAEIEKRVHVGATALLSA